MSSTETRFADALERRLPQLASAAARSLVGRARTVMAEDDAGDASETGVQLERWTAHYAQRLRELTVAVRYGEPELFLTELTWSRAAFQAREATVEELQTSVDCLRDTLRQELGSELGELAGRWTDRRVDQLATGESETLEFGTSVEDRLALSYLEALLDGSRQAAIRLVLRAVDSGLSIDDACEKVLLKAQRQVGAMWHQNEILVAQEHFVSKTTETLLAMLAERAPMRDANGCTVMICTPQGDAHDLGSRFFGDALERAGWNVIYLGADLPQREIVLGVEAFAPDLLALSASLAVHLPRLETTIRSVRATNPEIKTLAGGRIFSRAPSLATKIGADGVACTIAEGLQIAGELVGLSGPDA